MIESLHREIEKYKWKEIEIVKKIERVYRLRCENGVFGKWVKGKREKRG